jgi:hypothetical protein
VKRRSGYLVVSTDPAHIGGADRNYQGLYRTPPFEQAKYNAGFDDPYITDEFVDEDGLIPDIATADTVRKRFASVMPPEHLEVLWVTTAAGDNVPTEAADGADMLGHDVACLAPFWSIVADPAPDVSMPDLNEHGLLDSYEDAELLRERFADTPDGRVTELYVWKVWRLFKR